MKNDKNLQNIKKLAFGALFAALIFCGTYFIKLPMPFSEGYIHAGDGFVFLAAALLPAPYAMGAAAIGAGLSDLIGGYSLWIPATVGVRVLAVLLFSHRGEVFCARNFAALGGAAAINVAGYWAYESAVVYHDLVSALPSVPFNFAQSVVGALIFLLLAKPAAALLRRTAA